MRITPAKALAELLATAEFKPDDIYTSTNKLGNLIVDRRINNTTNAKTDQFSFIGHIELHEDGPTVYWVDEHEENE